METWSLHHLKASSENSLGPEAASNLWQYAHRLTQRNLPVIFTLKHLSIIVGVEYAFLRETTERRRESANYRIFAVKKRSGGLRFIHALGNHLQQTQKFLNTELLQKVPVHTNSYAFRQDGGISKCAAVHCGARWMFHFDLDNFFYTIREIEVYNVFCNLGYRPLLAMELARICTTTNLPKPFNHFLQYSPYPEGHYGFYDRPGRLIGVLPQGGPSSPMLSNLVARNLDEELAAFAAKNGFVVTRYADDLTLSTGGSLPKGMSVAKITHAVTRIIRGCGFQENSKKLRVAGPGSKKIVLGLLVDGDVPRLSKEMIKRIDRHLYASLKFGLANVAAHEKFESPIGFYNHLRGLVTYASDVDAVRGSKFKDQFAQISNPWKLK